MWPGQPPTLLPPARFFWSTVLLPRALALASARVHQLGAHPATGGTRKLSAAGVQLYAIPNLQSAEMSPCASARSRATIASRSLISWALVRRVLSATRYLPSSVNSFSDPLMNLKKARTLPQNAIFRGNADISVRRLGQNRFQIGLGELEFHFLGGRICRKSGLSRLVGRQSSCSTIILGAKSKLLG